MRVRPDIVKLDRNLTKAIHSDPARMVLVESFVRFARRTGAIVCAEGIESLDDLAVLGDLDVQWGQGYALARPAAPWALVSPVAAEVCRASLAQALRASPVGSGRIAAGDRRLEHLSARLASARSGKDLEGALALIGEELQADTDLPFPLAARRAGRRDTRRERRDARGALPDRRVPAHRPGPARAAGRTGAGRRPGGRPTGGRAACSPLGSARCLMVPVVSHGKTIGIVEAYSEVERPWTRTQINRARIISNQFGSVIQAVFRPEQSERARTPG